MEKIDVNFYPLVSLCMPAYNADQFIEETIESVLNQTYSHWELIIVDDNSTDNTAVLVSRYLGNPRISYFRQEKGGAGAARNFAFANSKGSYIKFLDADDVLSVDTVGAQVRLASKNQLKIVSGKWGRFYNDVANLIIEDDKHLWENLDGIEWIIRSLQVGPNMTQPGIFLIPRQLIERFGGWVEPLSIGPCDDTEFFTRLMLHCDGIVFCEDALLKYRSGIKFSLSKSKSNEAMEAYLKTIEMSCGYIKGKSNTIDAKIAIGNLIQIFIYNIYPAHRNLEVRAERLLAKFDARPSITPSLGKWTKLLAIFIGWKRAKRFRLILDI